MAGNDTGLYRNMKARGMQGDEEMKMGVLGTGMVGLAIANRLAELGHGVMIGTRDPSASAEKLRSKTQSVQVGTFAQAAAFGEMIFNATNGAGSLHAL
jgi:predicted dinucleotide-binding enzyme